MKFMLRPFASLSALLAAVACSGAAPSLEEDAGGGGGAEPADFELTLSIEKLPVLQGAEEKLVVRAARKKGFDGEIELSFVGLPEGASVDKATIAAGESEIEVRVKAAQSAPHSLPQVVRVKGKSRGQEAEKAMNVTVRGGPGSLDASFGQHGKTLRQMSASDDTAHALALDDEGRVLVAGTNYDGHFAVLRLLRDGSPDPSFGSDGQASLPLEGGSAVAHALAVQPDGKILVAGSLATVDHGLDFAVVRLLPDGRLDSDFASAGVAITPFGDDTDVAYAIAIQKDGKIVVAGGSNQGSSGSGVDFALARYTADGQLDADFGTAGLQITAMKAFSGTDNVYALALQELAGQSYIVAAGGDGDMAVARYDAAGELDGSFGAAGRVLDLQGSTIGAAQALRVDGENRIVLAGYDQNDFSLARLLPSGAPDGSFGVEGRVRVDLSADNVDMATGLDIDEDGRLLVGGWAYEGASTSANFVVGRFASSGSVDAGFGDAGWVVTDVAGEGRRDQAMGLVLQADDRVPTVRAVVAGSASLADSDFAVARFWL